MKNILFLSLTLIAVLGFTSSCESQDSTSTAPFTPTQVAISQEWIDYSYHVDELMRFFASSESVDMQKVRQILSESTSTQNSEKYFKDKVLELEGGKQYLQLSENISKAEKDLHGKFDQSVLDRDMIRRINEAYRSIRATQSVD